MRSEIKDSSQGSGQRTGPVDMYWGDRDMELENVLGVVGTGSGIREDASWAIWVGICIVSCARD